MSMFSDNAIKLATDFLQAARGQNLTFACAESCTGGLIGALLTSISGASDVFTHGFVTYANEAKTSMLGVPAELIEAHGAVSEEVATFMAEGALFMANADIAASVTGIAGPSGGSLQKPVGLVHIACARRAMPTRHQHHQFLGSRDDVRNQSVMAALNLAMAAISA